MGARSGSQNNGGVSRRLFTQVAGAGACALAGACGKAMPMDVADMAGQSKADLCALAEPLAVPEADQLKVNGTLFLSESETIITRDQRGFMAMWQKCRHSGCLLGFNSAARTYDCPCHGSRYTIFGEVMQGPAAAPLVHRDMCRTNGVLTVSMSMFLPDTSKRTL